MLEVDEAVRQIAALHRANGGSTFSLYFGDLAGRPLYAVSVYPERGRVLPGRELDPEIMRRFIAANLELLRDPRNAVGSWFNEADGNTYLDVSSAVADREQALQLAGRYNQIAIFDLHRAEAIETGETGEPVLDAPPLSERLPQLPRTKGRR